MANPTHQQMLALVQKRVPHFTMDRKGAIATTAIAVHNEPRHKKKSLMHAVKVAIARSYKHQR
jgi:hypothetical protein